MVLLYSYYFQDSEHDTEELEEEDLEAEGHSAGPLLGRDVPIDWTKGPATVRCHFTKEWFAGVRPRLEIMKMRASLEDAVMTERLVVVTTEVLLGTRGLMDVPVVKDEGGACTVTYVMSEDQTRCHLALQRGPSAIYVGQPVDPGGNICHGVAPILTAKRCPGFLHTHIEVYEGLVERPDTEVCLAGRGGDLIGIQGAL